MKLIKLDRRMTGYGDFQYMVKFRSGISDQLEKFLHHRTWCWENFGPSCELVFYKKFILTTEPSWCWSNNEYENRIYFVSEKYSSWYLLANS